jgi:cytochrome c peroxidase
MTLRRVTAVLLLISLTLLGALYGRRLKITNDAPAVETALRQLVAEIGLTPLTVDPIPRSPEQIALGRALFFETELSGNRDVSCATCPRPRRCNRRCLHSQSRSCRQYAIRPI